jgi:polyisoprenoid-binding protein YceI
MHLNLKTRSALPWVAAALFFAPAAHAVTYKADPTKSSITFTFQQAGAANQGKFGKVDVTFTVTPDGAGNKLDVAIPVTSLDTGDKERDDTLRSADLFNVAKFPQAKFSAAKVTKVGADKYEATGKLTIRDVTRDVRVPLTFKTSNEGGKQSGTMSGQVVIKRLDYGVGQGEWKSTEWVGNDVTVKFSLRLLPAAGT